MAQSQTRIWLLAPAGAVLLAGSAQAQSFQNNLSDIPTGGAANSSRSENVDFGDVDQDGDWDAVFADGGDAAQDRNRIWVNQGFAQGGTLGVFVDMTVAQLPAITDQSRDIEFVDFDNDTDLDIYISNTSALINQTNRWWTNLGNLQGGTAGFYVDETAARWVGLDSPTSSIPNSALLGSGGFIDWSCDCDFGDLDNDGDLDLVHSSYGGVFGGDTPTRIFLNDGLGFFEEFNPSGFKLTGANIANGNPALWCEGTHQSNTTNTNGTFADVASSALDIDLGDIDGDFDLDILHGARQEQPRMFVNRLDGSSLAPAMGGGQLGFRDVTNMVFPGGWSSGDGHYEQEMGDLDGDGDLDIYGLNWNAGGFSFTDVTLRNTGDGTYDNLTNLPNSGSDDNEGDFLDYDNDGDLDLYVANFSGQDRLYRNNWNGTPGGGGNFSFTDVTASELPSFNRIALDADACDVDGDGDYDLFIANDGNAANYYAKNITQTPDTHAPYIPNVEQAPDRAPGPDPTVIRAHVYDNAPYYITWYNETWVEYTVDGGSALTVPAMSSAGQIFRAELPGGLTGHVCYRFFSEDEYGNQGVSGQKCYDADGGGCSQSNYCTSTPNSTGGAAVISSNGNCVVADNNFVLTTTPVPNQFGIFYYSATQVNLPFGNGTLCAGGVQQRLDVEMAVGNVISHAVDFTSPPSPSGQITAGSTWHFSTWFRDPAAGGANFDLSNGLTVTFQ
ncbi:MAG: VCBS repeat-containing protein [Planctomycetota bacterium]|nr:MAG: VCBS repeat-containing protein [Planctomycetota bacterium]